MKKKEKESKTEQAYLETRNRSCKSKKILEWKHILSQVMKLQSSCHPMRPYNPLCTARIQTF
jgi:hypothetical protein